MKGTFLKADYRGTTTAWTGDERTIEIMLRDADSIVKVLSSLSELLGENAEWIIRVRL